MDRIQETTALVKDLNLFFKQKINDSELLVKVCNYFDNIKLEKLSQSDLKFLKYISNVVGVPHYYDLLTKFGHHNELFDINLKTFSSLLYESSLHVDDNIKIHKYQKQILDNFIIGNRNKFFLSATTSFGKTFLIYEIIKKLQYKNVALIFPTIALLSENYERLIASSNYSYFNDFSIHTLSDVSSSLAEKNIFIFTPERYLSFLDKYKDIKLNFVFVDEIYKIDNEYLIDSENKENERDTAYRIALHDILSKECDILLVGPYIEFPNKDDINKNQSFNIFLKRNDFQVIDFNKYEIVTKKVITIKSGINKVDDDLEINLKKCKNKAEKIYRTISSIQDIKENVLLYTSGPGKVERYVRDICKFKQEKRLPKKTIQLKKFISHLKNNYYLKDKDNNIWIVIKALEHKIGIHHGQVPKYIQKEIVSLFNLGYLDVLISTTTITEGVNTSAKNLVVLSHNKGRKELKSFDAKNIAGRAGRFLHHYSGRVIILDEKFEKILNSPSDEIKYKNYDINAGKNEIDYFITDDEYLTDNNKLHKIEIINNQHKANIPDEIMSMFKVISYSDKLYIYEKIQQLTNKEKADIKALIQSINAPTLNINYDGIKVVLNIIKPIVTNPHLKRLLESESPITKGENIGKSYPIIIYMLSNYINEGFLGNVKYYLGKGQLIDSAVRESSYFIFNTLKYQLVKYLGVFNIMYKHHQSVLSQISIDEVSGFDKLLIKLEYNALTEKGRLASDYGAPNKIIDYYENNETKTIKDSFDDFEKEKFAQISKILD